MYNAGYKNITNIDFSEAVINSTENTRFYHEANASTAEMKAEFAQMPSMQWLCMDALKMNFPIHSFDACIDKGMLDAIMWYVVVGSRGASFLLREINSVGSLSDTHWWHASGDNSFDNAAHVAHQMYVGLLCLL